MSRKGFARVILDPVGSNGGPSVDSRGLPLHKDLAGAYDLRVHIDGRGRGLHGGLGKGRV